MINHTDSWQNLQSEQEKLRTQHLSQLFHADRHRFERFSLKEKTLLLDFSKNKVTEQTMSQLRALAITAQLPEKISDLFSGKMVNMSENRSVLHPALRMPTSVSFVDKAISVKIQHTLDRLENFIDKIHSGLWAGWSGKPFLDIVNIGVGGSHLGSQMACRALANNSLSPLRIHFLSSIDPESLTALLKEINLETTLFILSSKSFTTHESYLNAKTIRQFITQQSNKPTAFLQNMVTVTANTQAAIDFGFTHENIFPIWDWVGGRYSIWSAIALPLMLKIGMPAFKEFLCGAFDMDQHFQTAPLEQNIPVTLGLLGIWHASFCNYDNHLIIPYHEALADLPSYLQQLEMESNGKNRNCQGLEIDYPTAPMVWGGCGSNAQHSFHQLLHQGTREFSLDFIFFANVENDISHHQNWLISSCLSQSIALMEGNDHDSIPAYKKVKGGHASNTLILDELTPRSLGALLALYEHKVFVQAMIWDINPYDQWGVELGKTLNQHVFQQLTHLQNDNQKLDSSTQGLISHIRQLRQKKGKIHHAE